MARIPRDGDGSIVSMAEYGQRAKRLSGNTEAIAADLKKSRQAETRRLNAAAEGRKTGPRLTLVASDVKPAPED